MTALHNSLVYPIKMRVHELLHALLPGKPRKPDTDHRVMRAGTERC